MSEKRTPGLIESAATAVIRIAPYALLLVLISSALDVYFSDLAAKITSVVGTLALLGFLWGPARAPDIETLQESAAGTLLLPRVGIAIVTVTVPLVALSFAISAVHITAPGANDGAIAIAAIDEVSGDSTLITLAPGAIADTKFLWTGWSGRSFTFRRGSASAQRTIRAWAPDSLTFPDDFPGPVRLFGLLGPDLMGTAVHPENVVRIVRGADDALLVEARVSSLAPIAFVLAASEPPPPDAADSTRWVERFVAETADQSRSERLVNLLLRNNVARTDAGDDRVRWFRSALPIVPGDSITIRVSRADGTVLSVKHLTLKERTTDVILRRTP